MTIANCVGRTLRTYHLPYRITQTNEFVCGARTNSISLIRQTVSRLWEPIVPLLNAIRFLLLNEFDKLAAFD